MCRAEVGMDQDGLGERVQPGAEVLERPLCPCPLVLAEQRDDGVDTAHDEALLPHDPFARADVREACRRRALTWERVEIREEARELHGQRWPRGAAARLRGERFSLELAV